MEEITVAQTKLENILKHFKIYDFVSSNKIYVGGSLPMLCLSKKTDLNYLISNIGDIDLYTSDLINTIKNLNNVFSGKIENIIQNGVNVKFNLKDVENIDFQLMTSGFKNFEREVLNDYDCDLVSVGYDCIVKKLIITPRFERGFAEKCFNVQLEKTYGNRIEKLSLRARLHFDSDLKIVSGGGTVGMYRPYIVEGKKIPTLLDCIRSPPYIQTYSHKYRCIKCDQIQEYLVCHKCKLAIEEKFDLDIMSCKNYIDKIIVFGGVNGLGKIVGDVAVSSYGLNVVRTGRDVSKYTQDSENTYIKFELGSDMLPELVKEVEESKLIIMNAYQTLEGDHKIWNNTIFDFDEELALKRFQVNCFGYIKLLRQIITIRKQMVERGEKLEKLTLVFMDAAESKFEEKVLRDGKHLELNMAKCATKQIFYTCGDLLEMLNIDVICYDPGWLSFHGISVENIESKSGFLISPQLSARCILQHCLIPSQNKSNITESSVYDFI